VDVARRLNDWQQAGDPRLWKIIISAEFGEQLCMPELARAVMDGVRQEIDAKVEWVAVAHHNTEHPHLHIAMRGIDSQGRQVRMPREFVQHGIRRIARQCCTEQLGYRTRAQAIDAHRREVHDLRYTALDRIIMRANPALSEDSHFAVTCGDRGRAAQFIPARLAVLERMGLARKVSPDRWQVHRDLPGVLREMQKVVDRQRTLSSGGVLRSDERLPVLPLDHRSLELVEGRILAHGEEENGLSYLMLESTDAKVFAIRHARQMQEMRHAGRLRVNAFVRLQKIFSDGHPRIEIEELGTAETILENTGYLRQRARLMVRKGVAPTENVWAGWLGRYQKAIGMAADQIAHDKAELDISR
jgi:hypothetical protein